MHHSFRFKSVDAPSSTLQQRDEILQIHHTFFTYESKPRNTFLCKKELQNSSNYSDNHLNACWLCIKPRTLLPILWPMQTICEQYPKSTRLKQNMIAADNLVVARDRRGELNWFAQKEGFDEAEQGLLAEKNTMQRFELDPFRANSRTGLF